MFRKTYLILAFVVSCLGCTQAADTPRVPSKSVPAHVIMHGDTDFTEDERRAVEEAVGMWRGQTGGLAQITVAWDLDFNSLDTLGKLRNESKIIKIDSENETLKKMDCEAAMEAGLECGSPFAPRILAWVSPGGGIHNYEGVNPDMVVVSDRLKDHKFAEFVILHEMGHVLGIPHINDTKAVMYPSASFKIGPICLTEKDLAGFCMANGCGDVQMHPCEGED